MTAVAGLVVVSDAFGGLLIDVNESILELRLICGHPAFTVEFHGKASTTKFLYFSGASTCQSEKKISNGWYSVGKLSLTDKHIIENFTINYDVFIFTIHIYYKAINK